MAAALDGWAERVVSGRPELRRVPAASLHVTLCFLGTRPPEEVEPIAAVVRAGAAPVPALAPAGAAWLPRHRPGVLAIDLEDGAGACAAVQRSLVEELQALGVYAAPRRPFRPHVTVARVRRGGLAGTPELPPLPPIEPFDGAAVTLFRSHLGRGGARYEALARVAPLS